MARQLLARRYTPTEPYLWYPSLDLRRIPWHTGSGNWGVQTPLVAPSAPVTNRQVTVHTSGDFATEAAVAGSEITIGTGWAETTDVVAAADDLDIIIPSGVAVGRIQLNGSGVRIRGTTIGEHSGGRMGQFRAMNNNTDVICDGIDLNGAASGGGAENNRTFRFTAERIAVVNCRAIAAAYAWLGDSQHCVVAGCSIYHGAATRAEVVAAGGPEEGWGIRSGAGPITIFDSQIAGTRYVNVRPFSRGQSGELLYIGETDLMALSEGRAAWLWDNLNNAPLGNGQGAIVEDSRIYGYCEPGCGFTHQLTSAGNVNYSRVRRNQFFNGGTVNYSQAYLDAQQAASGTAGATEGTGGPGDHDWLDDQGGGVGSNTFAALTAFPAWAGPGDPTAIPLPGGLTLITGEGLCPSIP